MTPDPATVEAMREAISLVPPHKDRSVVSDAAATVAERLVAEARAEERARIEAAIAKVRANYPTDVWPDDSGHAESKAAQMARQTCDNILAALSPQEADRDA